MDDDREHASARTGSSEKSDMEEAPIEQSPSTKKEKVEFIDCATVRDDVTLQSFAHLDIKRINRKIDLRIVPIVTVLYFLSFLDRGK